MKYVVTNLLVLITSVILLLYLMGMSSFLPYDQLGNTSLINIFVFLFTSFLSVYTFLNLFIYSFLWILRRKDVENIVLIKVSLKYSTILSFGILIVFLLNLFGVLDWIWGSSILFVVFITLIIV